MIIRARAVVTMAGPVIPGGAVRVEGEQIAAVSHDLVAKEGEETVELEDCALLPGLVNAHCHFDYTMLRGKIARPSSFTAWVREINEWRSRLSESDYQPAVAEGMTEAAAFGTTSVLNLTGHPALRDTGFTEPLRIWWGAELIDVRAPAGLDALVEKWRGRPRSALAPHALYTASPALIRRCLEYAREDDFLLTMHLAESRDEMKMFRDQGGPAL